MIRRALWRSAAPIRPFLLWRRRASVLVRRVLDRFPRLEDALLAVVRDDPQERYQAWIAAYDTIDDLDLAAMRQEQAGFAELPLLSLVVPVAEASEPMLEALERSLRTQLHERWEVWFAAEHPPGEGVQRFLTRATSRDARFRPLAERPERLADAWNRALRSAAGEFTVLVDPRVSLRPHALFLLARTIVHHPDAVLAYADEDRIDEQGSRSDHYFKPDWSEALLRSQNYLGGLVAFRRSLALAVGGCRQELDGDCAWGLFLRLTATTPPGTIHHLPFVLSHRPAREPPPAPDGDADRQRVALALEQRLEGIGKQARVEPVGESSYRTRYALPEKPPSVSLIVASTCDPETLRPCLEGILERTPYPDLEVLLVANEAHTKARDRRDFLAAFEARPRLRLLVYDDRPYNFSWVNNWAAGQARGELLCLLNDDTEVIGGDWLAAMVGHALQDRVAAVGAMLFFPNGRIQHAGVLLGAGGIAAHAYRGRPMGVPGYHERAVVDQDVSCVTAACMLVRRDAFFDVGGFDEALAVAFNDVDLCLRLHKAGWRIVWTPSAELYHRESASFGRHDAVSREKEWTLAEELIRRRWGEALVSDPHYSPNLSLDVHHLWEPAFPPRVSYPWRSQAGVPDGRGVAESVRVP